MWPYVIGAAVVAGLGVFLFEEKNAKAKTRPLPRTPGASPTTPIFKPEPAPPVFKPEPAKPVASAGPAIGTPGFIATALTPKPVDADVHQQMIEQGAVYVSSAPSGAETFRKPDGGLVTVLPTVDIVAGKASNLASINTQKDPLNIRKGPSNTAAIVGKAAKGTVVQIVGKLVTGPGSKKGWAPVRNPATGLTGFAAVDFLEIDEIDPAFQL